MMTAYLDAMRRYADFGGRATRGQYWWYQLVVTLIGSAALVIDLAAFSGPDVTKTPLFVLVHLAHLVPGLALGVRRLHDLDRSGWLMLLVLVPLVGPILLLVWFCQPGTPAPNRFGTRSLQGAADVPVGYPAARGSAPPAPAERDVASEIERLGRLRASGTLTEPEFETLKARTLLGTATSTTLAA